MLAVEIAAFGGPEGLAVVSVPIPQPGDRDVLIATEAISVGFQDSMIRSGALAAFGFKLGHVPGGEIAGTVIAVGHNVDASWIGRRVWAFVNQGGYAERVIAKVTALVPLPDDLSAIHSMAVGSAGVVACFGLRHARFVPGESVLVRGAGGPLGIMAVQLARRGGASVVAVTTSSAERGDQLRKLGATRILDRAGNGDLANYDVIIDVVAGSDMSSFLSRLAPNGRMVAIGAVAGFPPTDFAKDMFSAFQKSTSFATFSANTVPEAERHAKAAELLADASRGELHAVVHKVLLLEQAMEAHEDIEASKTFGRIVLVPSCVK